MSGSAEPGVAVAVHRFAAPPERVFDAWLDPELVARWMFGVRGDEIIAIAIDARVGGAFAFRIRRAAQEIEHVGGYREIDPPRRLAFTWGVAGGPASDVAIAIVPCDGGCELTLTHRMHPDWTDFASKAAESWRGMLAALDAALDESIPHEETGR